MNLYLGINLVESFLRHSRDKHSHFSVGHFLVIYARTLLPRRYTRGFTFTHHLVANHIIYIHIYIYIYIYREREREAGSYENANNLRKQEKLFRYTKSYMIHKNVQNHIWYTYKITYDSRTKSHMIHHSRHLSAT